MRRKILVFLGLLAFALPCFAQVYPITGTVQDNRGNAIPGATVIVLGGTMATVNTATQPGTPLATIYSDPGGTQVINQTTNPANTDGNGNFIVYAVTGSYVVQAYKGGNKQYVWPVTVYTESTGTGNVVGPASSNTADLPSYSDATGKNINDSGISAANVAQAPPTANAVQYVTATGRDSNSGTTPDNAHAKANVSTACAAVPGGTVYVGAGSFAITSMTLNSPCQIIGQGAGMTTLTYAPTSGSAIIENAGSSGFAAFRGLARLTLSGPGSGTSTVGIQLGATSNPELDEMSIRDVKITGFGKAVAVSAGTGNVLNITCDNCSLVGNGTGWDQGQGELMRIQNSLIAQNATGVSVYGSGLSQLSFNSNSCDDNTTICFSISGNGQIEGKNNHLENAGLGTATYFSLAGTGVLKLSGGDLDDDVTTGTLATFGTASGGNYLSLDGVTVFSAGRSISEAVNLTGVLNNGAYLNIANASPTHVSLDYADNSQNRVVDFSFNGTTHTSTAIFQYLNLSLGNNGFFDTFVPAIFSGNRTITAPDANTVLPQACSPVANTYVTGLSGTTGACSTAIVGLTPVKKTATYVAVDADRGTEFNFVISSAATFTTAAAANNWYVPAVINDPTSTATLTIAVPSGTLTNWGGCTVSSNQIALTAGLRVALATDNTNWYAICSVSGGSATSTAWYSPVTGGSPGGASATSQNGTRVWPFTLAFPVAGNGICYYVQTADNSANVYDIGIYNSSGTLVVHTGATAGTTLFAATNYACAAWSSTVSSLPAGQYAIALTSSAASPVALLGSINTSNFFSTGFATGGTTSGGVLNNSITFPTVSWAGVNQTIVFNLH